MLRADSSALSRVTTLVAPAACTSCTHSARRFAEEQLPTWTRIAARVGDRETAPQEPGLGARRGGLGEGQRRPAEVHDLALPAQALDAERQLGPRRDEDPEVGGREAHEFGEERLLGRELLDDALDHETHAGPIDLRELGDHREAGGGAPEALQLAAAVAEAVAADKHKLETAASRAGAWR